MDVIQMRYRIFDEYQHNMEGIDMISRLVNRKVSRRRRRQAFVLSSVIHGIAVIVLGVWLIKPMLQEIEDSMYVDIVSLDVEEREVVQDIPKPIPKPIPKMVHKVETAGLRGISSAEHIPTPVNPVAPVQEETPIEAPSILENVTRLAPSPESILKQSELDGPALVDIDTSTDGDSPTMGKRSSGTVGLAKRGRGSTGLGNFTKGTGTGQGFVDLGEGFGKLPTLRDEIGDKLGAILKGSGNELKGHIRVIRLKHSLSDWWQDPTAIASLIEWLEEWTPIRADMSFAGGALRLTDPKIMDAPLIIMTGHDRSMATGRNLMRKEPMKAEFSVWKNALP